MKEGKVELANHPECEPRIQTADYSHAKASSVPIKYSDGPLLPLPIRPEWVDEVLASNQAILRRLDEIEAIVAKVGASHRFSEARYALELTVLNPESTQEPVAEALRKAKEAQDNSGS